MSKLTLSFKGKVLNVYPLASGETVIGSDPSCQLHIDSLAVAPRHASVNVSDEEVLLRDLGASEGILINGKRIEGEHKLEDHDQVQIGKHTLEYHFEPSAPAPEERSESISDFAAAQNSPKNAWLQILTGNNVGKTISLKNNMTNLGKAGVQTAVIARRGNGYFITHLEGASPPLVDGRSIGEDSLQLHDGNIIQLGNVKMQFTLA